MGGSDIVASNLFPIGTGPDENSLVVKVAFVPGLCGVPAGSILGRNPAKCGAD